MLYRTTKHSSWTVVECLPMTGFRAVCWCCSVGPRNNQPYIKLFSVLWGYSCQECVIQIVRFTDTTAQGMRNCSTSVTAGHSWSQLEHIIFIPNAAQESNGPWFTILSPTFLKLLFHSKCIMDLLFCIHTLSLIHQKQEETCSFCSSDAFASIHAKFCLPLVYPLLLLFSQNFPLFNK